MQEYENQHEMFNIDILLDSRPASIVLIVNGALQARTRQQDFTPQVNEK